MSPGEYRPTQGNTQEQNCQAEGGREIHVGTAHVPPIRLENPHHKPGVGLDTQRDMASVVEKRSPELNAALTQLKSTP